MATLSIQQRRQRAISRSLAASARARDLYAKADKAIKTAIKLGAEPGEIFELRSGRRVTITDNFSGKDVVFRSARVTRYTIEDHKEPRAKAPKSRKPVKA